MSAAVPVGPASADASVEVAASQFASLFRSGREHPARLKPSNKGAPET